jgi:hypothetical protein
MMAEMSAADAEFERKVKERMGGHAFISFDGDDTCDDCRRWDRESRRCECGNRRLDWDEDELGNVYGQAY